MSAYYHTARAEALARYPRDPAALIALADEGDSRTTHLPFVDDTVLATELDIVARHQRRGAPPVSIDRSQAHMILTAAWSGRSRPEASFTLPPEWDALYPSRRDQDFNSFTLTVGPTGLRVVGRLDAASAGLRDYTVQAAVRMTALRHVERASSTWLARAQLGLTRSRGAVIVTMHQDLMGALFEIHGTGDGDLQSAAAETLGAVLATDELNGTLRYACASWSGEPVSVHFTGEHSA